MRFKSMAVFVFVWCMLVGSIAWGATEKSGLIYYPTDGDSLVAMKSAAESRGYPVKFKLTHSASGASTPYVITSDVSFSSIITLEFEPGARLNLSGATITLSHVGQIVALPTQDIFDGDGGVFVSTPGIFESDWWGVTPTDIQKAVDNMRDYFSIHFASGVYYLDEGIDFAGISHMAIYGDGQQNPRFYITSDITGGVFSFDNTGSTKRDIRIDNIEFRGTSGYDATAEYGLYIRFTPEFYANNFKCVNATNTASVYLYFSWGDSFTNCYLRGTGKIDSLSPPSGVGGDGYWNNGSNQLQILNGRIMNYFDGYGVNFAGGMDVSTIRGVAIESNLYGIGATSTGPNNVHIDSCYFEGVRPQGAAIHIIAGLDTWIIENCRMLATATNADITGASQTNPCVITCGGGHSFNSGETVYIEDVEGMTELNGNYYVVRNTTSTTFELESGGADVDATGYTAYTSGGNASIYDRAFVIDGANKNFRDVTLRNNRIRNNYLAIYLRGQFKNLKIYDNTIESYVKKLDLGFGSIPQSQLDFLESVGDDSLVAERTNDNLIKRSVIGWSPNTVFTTRNVADETFNNDKTIEVLPAAAGNYLNYIVPVSDDLNTNLRGKWVTLAVPHVSAVTNPTVFKVRIDDGPLGSDYTSQDNTGLNGGESFKWHYFYHPVSSGATQLEVRLTPTDTTNNSYFATPVLQPGIVSNVKYEKLPISFDAGYDPPSIANGSSITVTLNDIYGAELGDLVRVSFGLDTQGLVFYGYVSTDEQVKVLITNNTGGAIDLASDSLFFVISNPNVD